MLLCVNFIQNDQKTLIDTFVSVEPKGLGYWVHKVTLKGLFKEINILNTFLNMVEQSSSSP